MARLANVLLILATVYVTKCFIHFDGFHYYDKYHLQQLLKLLRDTYADAERELRLIFKNNTLTKQQFHDMINDWALKQSRILFDAIAENLNKIQQQIIQMERIAEESVNISSKEHENLLTKGNDSSASEEFNEISNGHKRSCKILCHSMNSNDIVHLNLNTTLKDEIINMIRNSTDDDQIVMGEMLELFEDSTEYSPILVQVPII
uniref:SXP/RAL-2 family protein Ani s 5-like cation-binding domain-containing protein n=1 Tax=Wuchereria bancrofti TaxID=6293 RepID=A0AAF5Q4N8_WUCBA